MQNNRSDRIGADAFANLVSLRVLRLDGNALSAFPVWDLSSLPKLSSLSLSGNPWKCECDLVTGFQELARSNVISDYDKLTCISNSDDKKDSKVLKIISGNTKNSTCSAAQAVTSFDSKHDNNALINFIPVLVISIALVLIVFCVVGLVFVFRTPMLVWLHSKYGMRFLGSGVGNSDRPYDAFVSYAAKDDCFVRQILAPRLEQETPCYRLCLQSRDLPSTSDISECLPSVSQLCARLVIVASRAYLGGEWTRVKFALQQQVNCGLYCANFALYVVAQAWLSHN